MRRSNNKGIISEFLNQYEEKPRVTHSKVPYISTTSCGKSEIKDIECTSQKEMKYTYFYNQIC
jgi:hypothetical protein